MQLSITSAGLLNSANEFWSIKFLLILGGILSLLDENTEKGPLYALNRLNAVVDVFWPEISDSISKVLVSSSIKERQRKTKFSFDFILKRITLWRRNF